MENIILKINENLNLVNKQFLSSTETELCFKLNSDKWSKKEILGHLIDSAQNNIRRVIVGQYKIDEKITYDQNIWIKTADYQNYNSNDLLNLFLLLNQHFCIIIRNLPIEQYENTTDWGSTTQQLVSLRFVIEDYLKHLEHHVNQLFQENYFKKFGEL